MEYQCRHQEASMQPVISIFISVVLIAACQGSKLTDARSSIGSGSQIAGSGGDGIESTTAPQPNSGEAQGSPDSTSYDSSIEGGNGTLVMPEIAIPPIAVAGASLTCSLTSSNSLLQCSTYRNSKKVDLSPSKFFYDLPASSGTGVAANWIPIAMTPVGTGDYRAPAPSDLPSSFVVVMRYSDKGSVEHLAAQVGTAALPYTNMVTNGNFESEFPLKSDSGEFFAASNASLYWTISTFPESPCSKDTILRIQSSSVYPGVEGKRWASLDSKCIPTADGVIALPSLMQNIKTEKDNFYFVSFQARLDSDAAKDISGSTVRVQWGSQGEARSLSFAPKSTRWETFHYNSTAESTSVRLYFVGQAASDRPALMFDNIQVFNMGLKPAP
jgi:hypothetical protein